LNARSQEHAVPAAGGPTGYIEPHNLRELWFHTGTACNLACPFCLEGSRPGDNRLGRMTLKDVRPYVDEAVALGVEQLSFTGGEPFIVKDFVNILRYAATFKPCLVLTNGTDPVLRRLRQIGTLRAEKYPIAFRVSIDYPQRERHDAGRGTGSFDKAWQGLQALAALSFKVSVARQMEHKEDTAQVEADYRALLEQHGLARDTTLVGFPDFMPPGARVQAPRVTEHCMTTYHTEQTRRAFMCAFSKMVIKKNGRMRVYACTLVDDDESYDLGATLGETLKHRIMLHHHRCFSCFKFGASCSELER
jgi:molybdenum cofactor biosynthesis enzyme MoaA